MGSNFSGLSIGGSPVPMGDVPPTKTMFVDTVEGSDGAEGIASSPFASMDRAFDEAIDGCSIFVKGKITEELLTPLGVRGARIRAWHNGVFRHSDGDNGYQGVHWTVPAAGGTAGGALLTVREPGWELDGILFVPKSDGSAVRPRRAESATYPDGGKLIVNRCKFIGTGFAIEDHGGSAMNLIQFCHFMDLTSAIKHTVGAGIASPLRWVIRRNLFLNNTNHIVLPGNQCLIEENVFDEATVNINTSGGTAGKNFVINNIFSEDAANITNGNGYTGHTTDVWRNYSQNTAAMTVGVPGA